MLTRWKFMGDLSKDPAKDPRAPKPDDSKNGRAAWVKSLGLFSVIITDLLSYTGGGILVGYLLWSKVGAPWWVLVVFALAGLTLSMYRLYLLSKKDMK